MTEAYRKVSEAERHDRAMEEAKRFQRAYWRLTRKFASDFVADTFTAEELRLVGLKREVADAKVARLLFDFAEALMIDRALQVKRP